MDYPAALGECKIKPKKATPTLHIHRTDLMMDQGQPQSPGRGVLEITAGQGTSWSSTAGKQFNYICIKNLRNIYFCLRE